MAPGRWEEKKNDKKYEWDVAGPALDRGAQLVHAAVSGAVSAGASRQVAAAVASAAMRVAAGGVADRDEEVELRAQAVGRALALHKALSTVGGEHHHCLGLALAAAKSEGVLSPTEYDAGRRVSRAANRARHEPFTAEVQLDERIAALQLKNEETAVGKLMIDGLAEAEAEG